jgi:ABC-type Fe3+-hydroxamate transport system substrate-binding protein
MIGIPNNIYEGLCTLPSVLDHPLYSTLGAAESGNVHVVDPLAWQQGGVAAANMVLDDLEGVFP